MKLVIKFCFLATILLSLTTTSFAGQISYKIKRGKDNPRDEELTNFDFNEVYAKAEKFRRASSSWSKLKCKPLSGFLCAKWSCKKRDVKNYLILDKKAQKITRCNDEACEEVEASFKQAGIYFNIQASGPIGTLIRVLGDSRYKEITAIGLDAYIGNGECEVLK